jgi:hypothetical protein
VGDLEPRSAAPAPGADSELRFTWITALGHGVDHAVTDEEAVASRGEYRAMCGALFVPAAMEKPPMQPCPPCVGHIRAHWKARDGERAGLPGRHSRSRWWTRIFGRGSR